MTFPLASRSTLHCSIHRSDQRTTAASSPFPSCVSASVPPPTQTPVATSSSPAAPVETHGACAVLAVPPSSATIPTSLPDEKHEEALPRYKRDLVAKIKILRTELQAQQPQSGHCRLEVSRAEIFEVRDENFVSMIRHGCRV